ncbi:6-pyruvoyl trahydropterin synthase family protein [Desulfobotulus mexicanus]|uniref:6-carboxy-5,6,7,8-tetrahydropterin synthase n=1 Tax=Desulfobotulus mexicanus TaxID=2586642 RepID=A0A5Q4VCE2_9BACT|nr:6-carboxytetrahydropterin synthase [Desulfobotulus mexicanus]TYT75359.1 6-carboxytetrahydropterin synthase [Desulfobotulus mexicanus]
MLSITREFRFEAAHRLALAHLTDEENTDIFGPCARIHGHSYRLRVTLSGTTNACGWILNFSELKKIVYQYVLSEYDHACLNELDDYRNEIPTAENMAKTIFNRLQPHLQGPNYRLLRICVHETENAWASWEESHALCS